MVTTKTKKSSSGMDIPDWAYETLARCLLPKMQQYYESEVGRKDLEAFRAEQALRLKQKQVRIAQRGLRRKTEPPLSIPSLSDIEQTRIHCQ